MKNKVLLTEDNMLVFDHALGLLDSSINELRRVAFNMMPENLYNAGLKVALQEFCQGMNQGTGTSVQFSFYGTTNRFDINKELILFRIAQELLNNSLKHSGAKQINMQLVQDNDRVSLIVQDNGIGFNPAELNENNSSGIRNIRSRVDSLGGVFSIDSEPGSGTEVTIEINL